jgi:K(+)-stimulated pyrophosphate-energized sodium pump
MGIISAGVFMVLGYFFSPQCSSTGTTPALLRRGGGVLSGVLIGYVTVIYTSASFKSVKRSPCLREGAARIFSPARCGA